MNGINSVMWPTEPRNSVKYYNEQSRKNELFVEAIGKELSDEALKESLLQGEIRLPSHKDDDEIRKQAVQKLNYRFFMPTYQTKLLYEKIHRAIKIGYEQGQSVRNTALIQQDNLANAMKGSASHSWVDISASITEFNCILLHADTGAGKTKALERCLQVFPQVIWHEGIGQAQIVYLKIDLASASSTMEYCTRFLESLSSAIGPEKYDSEVIVPRNENAALSKIETLVKTYNVGIVCIDSLDNILTWKTVQQNRLATHFYALGLQVPMLFASRNSFLHSDVFHSSRFFNMLSIGTMEWDHFGLKSYSQEGIEDCWNMFAAKIWQYSSLSNHPSVVPYEINKFWFETCQGNIRIAVHLYVQAQILAIIEQKKISLSLFKRVAKAENLVLKISHFKSIQKQQEWFASSKPKSKVTVESAIDKQKGLKRVPKSAWKQLPVDDFRHTFELAKGKNMYECLKLQKKTICGQELIGFDKFPSTLS